MEDSQGEITIGAVESSLGMARLSVCKSGEVTVTSPTSPKRNSLGSSAIADTNTINNSIHKLPGGMSSIPLEKSDSILMKEQKEEEMKLVGPGPGVGHEGVEMDLSALRGIQPPPNAPGVSGNPGAVSPNEGDGKGKNTAVGAGSGRNSSGLNNSGGKKNSSKNIHHASTKTHTGGNNNNNNGGGGDKENPDLEGLSELVPGLKTGKVGKSAVVTKENNVSVANTSSRQLSHNAIPHLDSMVAHQGATSDFDEITSKMNKMNTVNEEGKDNHDDDDSSDDDDDDSSSSDGNNTNDLIQTYTSKPAIKGLGEDSESSDDSKSTAAKTHSSGGLKATSPSNANNNNTNNNNNTSNNNTSNNNASNKHLEHPYAQHNQDLSTPTRPHDESLYGCTPNRHEFNHSSSVASISTATQTQSHEMRMPMYLPNFRPATGCTNASDFIVRCFAARLRSGITVVKHGRSRWCKSRLRILHVHSDGRSLSWKPAQGEPSSSKRPPKLDLSTCLEVRHAWSPDPLNPMFTGTPILRSKCEASNAFKSFALIFPRRTVDITAVTADQCKVLMEGFSALCFRLQVANMAGRGNRPNNHSMMNDDSGSGGKGAGNGANGSGKEERGTATSTSPSGSMNLSKRQ